MIENLNKHYVSLRRKIFLPMKTTMVLLFRFLHTTGPKSYYENLPIIHLMITISLIETYLLSLFK